MRVFLNGDFVDAADAHVSIDDRGFLFADGVYEVIRAVDGAMFLAGAHLHRLREGLDALRIEPPRVDFEPIADRLLRENSLLDGDATIYIQVTRGAAPRKHAFPAPPVAPTVYVAARSLPRMPEADFERGVAAIAVPDTRWARCDIKSVSLLPNVLANQQAKDAGAFEALFVRGGSLIEGSHSNLFGVVDGQLRTYPASNYILAGITRAVVIELAQDLGIPVRETPLYWDRLADIEELFLSGTTTDVLPVTRLDGRAVGDGEPGPVARALLAALRERMRARRPAGSAAGD